VKPLRAASLAVRLAASGSSLAPELSGDEVPATDMTRAPMPLDAAPHALSILVAEDNEINALLIRSLLTKLGHAPVITTDGEAALRSWLAADTAGAPYDLVLMDIQMPRLDGISATKRIRAHEAGRSAQRTAILALTANTLVDDRYACFEAGMDGFLIKPLDREKLSEALAAIPARSTTPAAIPARLALS
jgi:CheY-like chemotaxis protein